MWYDPLHIVYLSLLFVIIIIRKIHTSRYGRQDQSRPSLTESMILFFVGIAMIAPVVYIFSDVLDFASYAIAIWFRWNGVVFFVLACWLLWRSHRDLGENWTFTLKTNKKHQLVTTGVYRYLRHPMYAAHFSWAIAQLIMIPNWIAGPSFLVFALVLYCYRVGSEEEMMMDTFGDAYREYRSVTGRIFPRIFNFFSD